MEPAGPSTFCLLGKCANSYTVEARNVLANFQSCLLNFIYLAVLQHATVTVGKTVVGDCRTIPVIVTMLKEIACVKRLLYKWDQVCNPLQSVLKVFLMHEGNELVLSQN